MKNKKTIWQYFDENIEYPRKLALDPIPYGTVWTYVSSTFLNGFINYVEPIKCYVIDRYTSDDKNVGDKEYITKGDLKKKIIAGELDVYHTDLSSFEDDIIMLADIGEKGHYMFFWFDMDVSDCSIGRFKTEDTKEDVIQSVVNWLEQEKKENAEQVIKESFDSGICDYTELPLSFISGWVKF